MISKLNFVIPGKTVIDCGGLSALLTRYGYFTTTIEESNGEYTATISEPGPHRQAHVLATLLSIVHLQGGSWNELGDVIEPSPVAKPKAAPSSLDDLMSGLNLEVTGVAPDPLLDALIEGARKKR